MKVIMQYINLSRVVGVSFLIILGGCSINESDKQHYPQKIEPTLKSTVISSRPTLSTPRTPVIKKPVKVIKPYKPQVKRYSESKPDVRVLTDEEQVAFNKAMIQLEKKRREVNDPYASIPDDKTSSSKVETRNPSIEKRSNSSAVDSLILQARAEMMVGKHLTAESKIERGLRIDPENPKLWTLLAKAHYGQSNYSQSISMARKAIQFSRDDDLTARNWRLIKQAGKKSGDTFAVKEADDYIKMNP